MKIGNVKGNAAKGKYLCGIQQLKTMRATASYSYPPRLTATALGPRDLVGKALCKVIDGSDFLNGTFLGVPRRLNHTEPSSEDGIIGQVT